MIYKDHNNVKVHLTQNSEGTDTHNYVACKGGNSFAVQFQNGNPAAVGFNGLTNEHVLSMLQHRLTLLNAKFDCTENEEALAHISAALECLEERTAVRQERGVEGQEVK